MTSRLDSALVMTRRTLVVSSIAYAIGACQDDTPADSPSETSSGTQSLDSSSSTTSSSATSESTTTSSADESSSTSTSGMDMGTGDKCPPADEMAAYTAAGAIALDWPDGAFLDATCEALSLFDKPFGIELSCIHPESGDAVPVRLNVSGNVEDQLDWIPGTTGLRLSFFSPPKGAVSCYACVDVSLRDAEGRLVLLSRSLDLLDAVPAEGAEFDMTGPKFLDPRSAEYQGFSAPFTSIELQHVGCAPRDNIRPGSEVETPLAIEFAFDGGEISLYDRNIAEGVEVGDERFDIIVANAFFRGPLNCGDCPPTEANYLVLRSSR
jgi:hypothetical protein